MTRRPTAFAIAGLGLLFVATQGFVWHSAARGVRGLQGDITALDRLAGPWPGTAAISLHMLAGALVTTLSVIQLAGPIRRRWPRIHRVSGRTLVIAALITGIGGLTYIGLRGTVGGTPMSVGFGLYGILMVIAALQTPRFAMAGDDARHRRWGLRLIVLGLGSWFYRLHYGLWYGTTCTISEATCGMGAASDFTGLFDQIQLFAFYLPYLLVLEVYLKRAPQKT